ncbi:MAG: OpgC domain-containing protein [Pseudomonadota bacterium]
MTFTTPTAEAVPAAPAPKLASLIGTRDPRLDFFRGIAMFIILIAHTPGNYWTLWIPARFGWSDATEIFVFCSGMASAIAFGKVFATKGLGLGATRVGYRIWQVYWAHIGLFFAVAMTMAALNGTGLFDKNYISSLNLQHFFNRTDENLVGLMTLTYVPNYFDILPMYIVALALMPVMVALARVSPYAAFALMGILWLGAQEGVWQWFGLAGDWLEFPAEPWSDREWFFNPFGWQLIFFTGFAFMAGWLPAPPVDKRLIWLAVVVVLVTAVLKFNWSRTYPNPRDFDLTAFETWLRSLHLETRSVRVDIRPLTAKTDFGLFRYLHFLALAYLAWVAVGPGGSRILPGMTTWLSQVWAVMLTAILKVGQQSLAVFVFSMWYARIQGVILDEVGRNGWTWAGVNLSGMALLVAVAYGAGWIKSQPWRTRKAPA